MTISKTYLNVTHAIVGSNVFSNFQAPLLHTIHTYTADNLYDLEACK